MVGMMAGTAMQPPAAAATGQFMSASIANSFRVAAVAERLALHVQPGFDSNPAEFFGLCLSLARGIDFAVANSESLPRAHDLPILLRQVCQRKNDVFLQAPIMVLMASVKNACTVGWFKERETQELFTLANEIAQFFCTSGDVNTATNDSLSVIPTIMSRFYPLMKMGQILVSLEVKPGYGTYMLDFHISKTIRNSPEDKIRLLVAQTDNTETSACIITPQDVNFLLNGKGVERRTNVFMDTGPQMPTNVTGMLKYGTNLLQAIGQFKGHYVIVVAFMSVEPLPESPVLNDYVQSSAAELDPDSDIIEGPSRISLSCPISYTRIKTPAKGHSCKHLRCFDFSNFVDINTRRPSWRCPHCNQHVCYTDIRIDQNMAKVLKEVGENISDVIISADGSWKAVSESADKVDQSLESAPHTERGTPEQPESTTSTSALPMVVDLTGNDDEMDAVGTSDAEDRKPSLVSLQTQYVDPNPSQPNDANPPVQNHSTQLAEDFWSSYYQSVTSSATPNAQMMTDISELTSNSIMTGPVITDAISPALNRDVAGLGNTAQSSVTQNGFSVPNNIQLQQSQFVNSVFNNEYGTLPHIPRHISRNPVAVQALPAGPQTPIPQQRPRTNLNPAISNGTSLNSQATLPVVPTGNGLNRVSTNMDRQQQLSRSHNMAPALLQHRSTTQNWNPQGHSLMHGQSLQHITSEFLNSYRAPSQTLLQQQTLRMPQSRSQSPSIVRSCSPLAPSQTQQGVAQVGNSAGPFSATQRGFRQPPSVPVQIQTSRAGVSPPSVPVQIQASRAGVSYPASGNGIRTPAVELRTNVGGALPAVSGSDSQADLSSEQNWRPTGRMRGSLSGRAYSAALNQFMSQPTQTAQAPRPPRSTSLPSTSSPSSIPPHLQALLARTAQVHQAQNSSVTGSAISSGSSGTLP